MSTVTEAPSEQSITTAIDWTNDDNDAFYTAVNVEGLKALAEKGSLADGCDVRALKPYWESANTILDAASGYGRVIETLLQEGFQGEITAIERNAVLYEHLQSHYANRVTLHKLDLHNCSAITERFDVILFLWSSLADFAPMEQAAIVQQLAKLLAPQGILILDTMPVGVVPISGKSINRQLFSIKKNCSIVYAYISTLQEIQDYAIAAQLVLLENFELTTQTARIRHIYILGETRIQPFANKQ